MAVVLVDAGGGGSDDRQYGGRITVFVALSCVTAALGGAIFGYDLGTSGKMLHGHVTESGEFFTSASE